MQSWGMWLPTNCLNTTEYSEAALSLMRTHVVRGTTLAQVAREIDIGACLLVGVGERKSGGRDRDSVLADSLEAILGAIHIDGGLEVTKEVIIRLFSARIAGIDPANLKDFKTRLQEHLQGLQRSLPSYEVESVEGADHAREYVVSCTIDDGQAVLGRASSRRKAEQAAADKMLALLGVEND